MYSRLLPAVLASLALTAACGGSGPEDDRATSRPRTESVGATSTAPPTTESSASARPDKVALTVDPCTVLTKQDAEALAGDPVKGPDVEMFAEGGGGCVYVGRTAKGHDVEVRLSYAWAGISARQFETYVKAGVKDPLTPVQGLGEAAFFVAGKVNPRIQALKSGYDVTMTVSTFDSAFPLPDEGDLRPVAEKALAAM